MDGQMAKAFRCKSCKEMQSGSPILYTIACCKDCVIEAFQLAAQDESQYPPNFGYGPLTITLYKHHFPPEFVHYYQAKTIEYDTRSEARLYCHGVNADGTPCATFLGNKTSVEGLDSCWNCGTRVCICDDPSDDVENHVCQPLNERLLYPSCERGKTWQRCPNDRCKAAINLPGRGGYYVKEVRCGCCAMRHSHTWLCFICGKNSEALHRKNHWGPAGCQPVPLRACTAPVFRSKRAAVKVADDLLEQTRHLREGMTAIQEDQELPIPPEAPLYGHENSDVFGDETALLDIAKDAAEPDDEIAAADYLASFNFNTPQQRVVAGIDTNPPNKSDSEPILDTDAVEPGKEAPPANSLVFEQEFLRIGTVFEASVHPESINPEDQTPDAAVCQEESKVESGDSITVPNGQEKQSSWVEDFLVTLFWIVAALFGTAVLGLIACVLWFHAVLLMESL